ncbi:hypothetical protein SAY87_024039 [Trapa incisa]|uniref:RNA-directed DNA methylation 4 n=1 Tax=Trapa incisa TaxID=236973 RepID=A0AAN7L4H0_9MYRT|nr:hypothetical protein SAY87_024039 [Trapa incisa]
MEATKDGSSGSGENNKPVIVRVKRKASHSLLDTFWLQINERPVKRILLDFENLSIANSSGKVAAEEPRTRRVLVKHVDTSDKSEATPGLLKLLMPECLEGSKSRAKNDERRCAFKRRNVQDLSSKSRETKEAFAKNARFEQIWSRRGNSLLKDEKALHEMYHFYDVVRIDEEEKPEQVPEKEYVFAASPCALFMYVLTYKICFKFNCRIISLEDQKMLGNFLPLLREFIPDAATEIELDLNVQSSKKGTAVDDYMYDYYVIQDSVEMDEKDCLGDLPLVNVDDTDDFYDGPDSEYETDDSNDENNPLNDYPDEISDESPQSEETETDSEEEEDDDNPSGEDVDPLYEDMNTFCDDEGDFDYADGDAYPHD